MTGQSTKAGTGETACGLDAKHAGGGAQSAGPKLSNHMSNLTQGGEALIEVSAIIDQLFDDKGRALQYAANQAAWVRRIRGIIETALTHKSTEEDRLREAVIEECAKVVEDHMPVIQCMSVEPIVAVCERIATAIRRLALSPEGEEGLDG